MDLNTNISQEVLESVERYLNKTMSINELQEFEKKLEKDIDFRVQVEDIKTLLFGIESQSLKEQLEDYHKEIPETKITKKATKVRFLEFRKIAAVAVIIIAFGSFWFFNQNQNDTLFAKYFTPDPGLATTMGNNSSFEFYDAMIDYKQGNYDIAISKWEKIYVTMADNDTLTYFLGTAYLANKNEEKAIHYLKKMHPKTKSIFSNDAFYYLGLAYLKTNDIELAKKNLRLSSLEKSKLVLSELND